MESLLEFAVAVRVVMPPHSSQSLIQPSEATVLDADTGFESSRPPRLDTRVVLFGVGMAVLVLYICTFVVNVWSYNDFHREAWVPYRLLHHGQFLAFLRAGPAYVGSLLLRAPFALIATAVGAGARATYFATALPCVVAPAILAGFLAGTPLKGPKDGPANGNRRGPRPIDFFMVMPPALAAVSGGHPEDILGATLCVAAVMLAQRGSGTAAGFVLALALINKPWAVVVVPLVFAVTPADRRLATLITVALTAGIVMIPVTAIRATSAGAAGSALGGESGGIFLIPQLLWWFGRDSWVAREAHILLVLVIWLVTVVWWWFRVHGHSHRIQSSDALLALALVLFLRAALDPWDNLYYFAPFMLTLTVYNEPPGFPKLTLLYVVLLPVMVPSSGPLTGLGPNGHAAAFAAFSLITIVWLVQRLFTTDRAPATIGYEIASGSRS